MNTKSVSNLYRATAFDGRKNHVSYVPADNESEAMAIWRDEVIRKGGNPSKLKVAFVLVDAATLRPHPMFECSVTLKPL